MLSLKEELFLEEQYFRQKRELRALNLLFILVSIPFMYALTLGSQSGQGALYWSLDLFLRTGLYWTVLTCFFFIYEHIYLFFDAYAKLARRQFLEELITERKSTIKTSPN